LITYTIDRIWPYLAVSLASVSGTVYILSFVGRQFKTVGYLCQLLGEQYGFVRTKYHVGYEIGEDGSATVKTMEALRSINAPIQGVEHYTAVLTSLEDTLGKFRVSLSERYSGTSNIKVLPKLILSTPNRLYFQLLFEPSIMVGKELEYVYEVNNPPSTFVRSQEELVKRGLPYDYISMKIAYPTEEFAMKITFPLGLDIDQVSFDVWMGDARLRLDKEYQRLKNGAALIVRRQGQNQIAELVVKYPILDLKYAVTWRPVLISGG